MGSPVAHKLIRSHLIDGDMRPGEEIALRIDQTLTQDATGTLVMLELEALGLDRIRTELSAQYVDHNLLQEDFRNPDDHIFLRSACRRYGIWYSRPGNGISHPVHQEHFGAPGRTLIGSDSHTPAAGALGMLAIGAGGLAVATAMAGEPFHLEMPCILGVRLEGRLPPWVSAKDVILEMLRRRGVDGGTGRIIEYHGPGLRGLSVMDRHVIANMGAETGATTTVFPSDEEVQRYLRSRGRGDSWMELIADGDPCYDEEEIVDLSQLEPLVAMPCSPGNVRPVREVAGEPIYQAYVGSSANPGFRDFAMAAKIVEGRVVDERVSFDINPTSREILEDLVRHGHLASLIRAGARLHQAGCNGCIGMGQAPASGRLSLRTVPRNFPGRSGTRDDRVCLVSPETAAASALTGEITDPRTLEMDYPRVREPREPSINDALLEPPPGEIAERATPLEKGPNIGEIPDFEPLPNELTLPILLKAGDDLSTDEILPAGARVLPFRSNVAELSAFSFKSVDRDYAARARSVREASGHAIVGGRNYGQGSSREHAALGPRWLGLRVVLAKGFARIHMENLVNFGVLPVTLESADDYQRLEKGHELAFERLHDRLRDGRLLEIDNHSTGETLLVRHRLSSRQIDVILAGGLINRVREQLRNREGGPG